MLFPLTVAKVTGDSMYPDFCNKDYVLAIKRPFFSLKQGDIVLLKQESYGNLIKQVGSISQKNITVHGNHPESTDSKVFGEVSKESVYAKVLVRIPAHKKP